MNYVKNIAFWDNNLNERGTSVSLYDYAYFNEKILGNKSYVFYGKNGKNIPDIIDKFKKIFTVHETDGFKEVESYLIKYNISHIYIIKSGEKDGRISNVAKNCIHCVFNCGDPHGDVYSAISDWIPGNDGKYPVIPHMVNLPDNNNNMRKELNIPENAIVFGGYGGSGSFNIKFVQETVYLVAQNNPNIYFLFANFNTFCPSLKNIIHIPAIYDLNSKVEFINTCDAMIHGRDNGETFGISIAEFSTKNKPVICTKMGDLAHINLLGDKAILYTNENDLNNILINFNPEIEKHKDWNAYSDYTPEKVMSKFKEIYLD
jgi:hypothetical protein